MLSNCQVLFCFLLHLKGFFKGKPFRRKDHKLNLPVSDSELKQKHFSTYCISTGVKKNIMTCLNLKELHVLKTMANLASPLQRCGNWRKALLAVTELPKGPISPQQPGGSIADKCAPKQSM